jgi:hypothetical protein
LFGLFFLFDDDDNDDDDDDEDSAPVWPTWTVGALFRGVRRISHQSRMFSHSPSSFFWSG